MKNKQEKEKINIEINKKDFQTLAELAFMGDWLVNAVRLRKDTIKKYSKVCHAILEQHLNSLTEKEKGDVKTVGALHDYFMDELSEHFLNYEEKRLIPNLAEKMADISYPKDDKFGDTNDLGVGDSFLLRHGIHGSAESMIEELLEEKGFGILKLDDSEFEKEMKISKEYWNIMYGKSDLTVEERKAKAVAFIEEKRGKGESKRGKRKKKNED